MKLGEQDYRNILLNESTKPLSPQEWAKLGAHSHPLFDLSKPLEPHYKIMLKKGLVPIFYVAGTGHDTICYDIKKNIYCVYTDDSDTITNKSTNLSELIRKHMR